MNDEAPNARGRQARQDAEYRRAINELSPSERRSLIASLTPNEQAKINAHERFADQQAALAAVLLGSYESGQGSKDVSEWVDLAAAAVARAVPLADVLAETFDLPPALTGPLVAWMERHIDQEAEKRRALTLNRIVGGLLRPGNPVVRTHCLAIAAQLDELNNLGYRSLTQAGQKLNTGKANMSKGVNEWCDLLALPRPPMLKSQAARERYSADKKTNHWRKNKCQASKKTPPKK